MSRCGERFQKWLTHPHEPLTAVFSDGYVFRYAGHALIYILKATPVTESFGITQFID